MAFDDDAPAASKTVAAAPQDRLSPAEEARVSAVMAIAQEQNGTDAIVDAWFNGTFPGSVVARTTEAWNYLHNALPDLKRRLNGKG